MAASGDPLHVLAGALRKPVACPPDSEDFELRRQLQQRSEHESPLMHARVRHLQAGLIDARIAIKQEVEIERARRISEAALAAMPPLYSLKLVQQGYSRQCGVERRDRIDEIGLRGMSDRRRAIKRRVRC